MNAKPNQALITLVLSVPPEAAPVLAAVFTEAARILEKCAPETHMPEVCSKKATGYFDACQTAAKRAIRLVSEGMSVEAAVAQMTQSPPHPTVETAQEHYALAIRREVKQKRLDRQALATRMVKAGAMNETIARTLKVSTRTAAAMAAKSRKDQSCVKR